MAKSIFYRLFRHSFVRFIFFLGFFWTIFIVYLILLNSSYFEESDENFIEIDVAKLMKAKLAGVVEQKIDKDFEDEAGGETNLDDEMILKEDEEFEVDEYYDEETISVEVNGDIKADSFVVIKPTMQNRLKSFPKPTLSPKVLTLHRRLNLTNPGHMGAPVILPAQLDLDIEIMLNKSRAIYQINEFLSTLIPLDRELPDIRTNYCKAMNYSKNLPQASIIMVYHNEPLSLILRTIYAIYNRSPDHLVREILLIDDCSTLGVKIFLNLKTFLLNFK